MGVNIQRYADVRMPHDILQRLWIHSGFRHIGTKSVSAYMRSYFGHLNTVNFVIFLNNMFQVLLPMKGDHWLIRDIREAHKKDSESAPQTTVADELKENLEAVENFKGSRDEKLVVLYCKQLGINYKNLSDEEFRWLIRILKKSKKMGTPISQRKKR